MHLAFTRRFVLAALATILLTLAACGGSEEPQGDVQAPSGVELETDDLPPALAANAEQANVLIDEGDESLEMALSRLEGHPVVVNQWASWCAPCQREFPIFGQAAQTFADQVAFLGLNAQDSRDGATSFLADNPVPYPHVFDPGASQAASLGAGRFWPTTVYIDEAGEVVEVFQGEYVTQEQLDEQIRSVLLGGASS